MLASPPSSSPGPPGSRDFRLFWLGESVSVAGSHLHFVALPWLVLQHDGSGLALGTVLMTAAVPRAVFMLVGGAVSDRWSPRRVLLASNLARAVLAGTLGALAAAGRVELWWLLALSGLFGLADAFFYPSYAALVPRLVHPERLASAHGLLQATSQGIGLLAPAAGGLVIAAGSTALAFGLDAISFLFAAAMLWLVRCGGGAGAGQSRAIAAIASGLREVWHDATLRPLLAVIAVVNLGFVGPFVVGGALLARERLEGGAAAMGLLFSALAAGALAGSLAAGRVDRSTRRRGRLLIGALAIVAGGLAALAAASTLTAAVPIVAAMGAVAGTLNPLVVAWLQQRTRPERRGLVMSVAMLAGTGLTPLSYAAAGALAGLGTGAMFLGASALVALLTIALAPSLTMRNDD